MVYQLQERLCEAQLSLIWGNTWIGQRIEVDQFELYAPVHLLSRIIIPFLSNLITLNFKEL